MCHYHKILNGRNNVQVLHIVDDTLQSLQYFQNNHLTNNLQRKKAVVIEKKNKYFNLTEYSVSRDIKKFKVLKIL